MKKGTFILLLLATTLLSSCSTQKNTWASRSFHQMKTKYNIQFNGQIAFDEGQNAIREAHEDNYTAIIKLLNLPLRRWIELSRSVASALSCTALKHDQRSITRNAEILNTKHGWSKRSSTTKWVMRGCS